MKTHFDSSLNYLYTGVQYDGQFLERPGLAKKLRDMSDAHWEAGMTALNKFIEHGGVTNDKFVEKLHFEGEGKAGANMPANTGAGKTYRKTFDTLKSDSKGLLHKYNSGYRHFCSTNKHANADLAHYFEEKAEKEVKHLYELEGHIITLTQMEGIGAAVAAFDSNL